MTFDPSTIAALKATLNAAIAAAKFAIAFIGWGWFFCIFLFKANDSVFFMTNDESLIEAYRSVYESTELDSGFKAILE